MLITFLIFFTLFTVVGLASSFFKKGTVNDYFLAGRDVPAWLVALSYGATISSGATFIGFAGLAYHSGITALVATTGLMIGDHIGWLIAGQKIRQRAEDKDVQTYPAMVGILGDKPFPHVTTITAILTVIFLGAYCAAQLVAGAKIGEALFDLDFDVFVVLGAAVLLGYCWSGGIRASIWTDAVQALIIFISLVILIISGIGKIGGFGALLDALRVIDPALLNPFQTKLIAIGVGWIAFGVGVLGQPQLMIRHMVIRSGEDLRTAKRIYLLWRWVVLMMAVLSGLIARVLIPAGAGFDAELSIPLLWLDLLPPVLVGFLVAGLFSATMSTADSLLLSASSALSQHIIPRWNNSYRKARIATVIVIAFVVAIALSASKGVLALVVIAWGGMAAAVAPLVVVQLLGARPDQRTAITMMIAGFATTLIWRHGLALNGILMELVPGMLAGFAVWGLSHFRMLKS